MFYTQTEKIPNYPSISKGGQGIGVYPINIGEAFKWAVYSEVVAATI